MTHNNITEEDFSDKLKCPKCGETFEEMDKDKFRFQTGDEPPREPNTVSPHYQHIVHLRERHDGKFIFAESVEDGN